MTSVIIYSIVTVLVIISFIKSPERTKKAFRIGFNSFKKLLPVLIPILVGVGIVLSILSPDTISAILGEKSGLLGVIIGLGIGSVAFMPSFVAFPLGANLLNHGAGYPQIAAFISSLMAVGLMSLGLEIQYFGKKTALIRNFTALTASIVFVVVIWRALL